MNQSINTDSKNSKEPQQKYRLGMVSIKILGGLNRFYGKYLGQTMVFYAEEKRKDIDNCRNYLEIIENTQLQFEGVLGFLHILCRKKRNESIILYKFRDTKHYQITLLITNFLADNGLLLVALPGLFCLPFFLAVYNLQRTAASTPSLELLHEGHQNM